MSNLTGKAWIFGNDVNTDEIIPAKYLNTIDNKELAKHCMEDIKPGFYNKMAAGDIIVAGKNFGCGSSREHAPWAIKATGIASVIAASFARIFYRNSFNIGLPIFETQDACKIGESDELEIDYKNGEIKNITKNEIYTITPIPDFMQMLVSSGGLMKYAEKMRKDS